MSYWIEPDQPGLLTLGGAPEGHDVALIAELASDAGPGGLLHIATDDNRAAFIADTLAILAPGLTALSFPAWDCLPYDRVSPKAEIVSARIATLAKLIARPKAERVVITTVNAISQRVLPRGALKGTALLLKPGDRVDVEQLRGYLAKNGYTRSDTVREPGEFALRGGIVDLFPPARTEPLRLDLFGDELERIRRFDPITQRTAGNVKQLTLLPTSEVAFDPASIERFRVGYREHFGAILDDDPLYAAISEGRAFDGAEHWLPLFHTRLETLFDYLPGAPVSFDDQLTEALAAREGQITDFYEARELMRASAQKSGGPSYKPIPPTLGYLASGEVQRQLDARAHVRLTSFSVDLELTSGSRAADAGGRRGHDFAEIRAQPEANVFDAAVDHIDALTKAGKRVIVAGYSEGARVRLGELLGEHGLSTQKPIDRPGDLDGAPPGTVGLLVLPLEHGYETVGLAVLTEQDILGDRLARPRRRRRKSENFIAEVSSLTAGDFVVHVDHGIGRFEGLETVDAGGAPHDCLRLIYEGGDRLFLPVENLELLTRYGAEDAQATLDKLGGAGWQARKAKVKKRIKDMTTALMRVAALRAARKMEPALPPDGVYEEFCARFPYPETDDQLRAIEDVVSDLASGLPMDRLICGDVGFGKTEVAMRAAFIAAMSGRQVAVVVPTTLLARQHYAGFSQRFQGLPLRVAQLSRLVTAKDAKLTKAELKSGGLDIIIGTHALLAGDVDFARLGLVIIDEEQHFGVKQKEKLKQLRSDVHVLTLTATPIPRTLQLSLAGVRELSLIATPPVDRLAVRTFVLPYDPVVVREALMREHFRGGQSFYVCPRLEDLPSVEAALKELVPDLKVISAHGRLAPAQLEEVMSSFVDGRYDVLLATNIIESGLDIPRANTLIVHRADMFGLAQLYQIRGRVGRAKVRAYAYLTTKAGKVLQGHAKKRLSVIETLDTLGAGFQLASYDLDIRGAGNLLGEEQSGQIRDVGIELYQQLLQEAVEAQRTGLDDADDMPLEDGWTPSIQLGIPVLIPESYVADLPVRMDLYRRVAAMSDHGELDAFAAELIDRFGPIPEEVDNLLSTIALKGWCRKAGIERLDAGPKGAVIAFRRNTFANVDGLMTFLQDNAASAKLRPDQKLVFARAWEQVDRRVKGARKLVRQLADLAG